MATLKSTYFYRAKLNGVPVRIYTTILHWNPPQNTVYEDINFEFVEIKNGAKQVTAV